MRLNLKNIGAHGEESLAFESTLDLSAVRRWGEHPIPDPVAIAGTARGRNGVYFLDCTAQFEHASRCARCLADVLRHTEMNFSHSVVEELADETADEFILAPGGELELDELVRADILLALEENLLCKPDCRGICPACGRNRNAGGCGCEAAAPDPRFDKLREWMRQQDNPTD